jgi:hypothetical protein
MLKDFEYPFQKEPLGVGFAASLGIFFHFLRPYPLKSGIDDTLYIVVI